MKSIVIVKTSAIGDVIQAFPVLEYLRKKFPNSRIDWVVEEGIALLLRAHPMLDQVIEIQTKSWRKALFAKETRTQFMGFVKNLRATHYDLAIDLQGNTKSALVTASAKATIKLGYGWQSVREKSNLIATRTRLNVPCDNVRLKYLCLVQKYFNDPQEFQAEGVRLNLTLTEQERFESLRPSGACLMVCFGSRWINKRLDKATLLTLLQTIAKEYKFSFILIYADEEEKAIAENLAATLGAIAIGNLSLPLWQALMWEVDGIIAVDSAALHLCGTTLTPSFSVFGPSLASYYKPSEERHLAVQGICPYGKSFTAHCSVLRTCSTGACIRELKVEDLFTAFQHWADKHLSAKIC
jgi:heptosyltransferase-1